MTDNVQIQNFNNLQEKNQQVLNNISQLQQEEKKLYDSLDDVSLTSEQKQQIINKINEISQIRMNLYSGLKNMYASYQNNVSESRTTLGQSMAAVDVLENELNQSKIRLNLIEDQMSNKLRLVEINTYYSKQYNSYSKLMKTIVVICIPLIILAILANKGILPFNVYTFLSGIVIIIGVFVIGAQLIDLSNRDNMNWDEYNWYFNIASAPSDTTEGAPINPWKMPSVTCIGSACCYDNSTYDSEKNICIPNEIYQREQAQEQPVETFESLSKYGYAQEKAVNINNNVQPLNASLKNF